MEGRRSNDGGAWLHPPTVTVTDETVASMTSFTIM
jgi:hypothetical protein